MISYEFKLWGLGESREDLILAISKAFNSFPAVNLMY